MTTFHLRRLNLIDYFRTTSTWATFQIELSKIEIAWIWGTASSPINSSVARARDNAISVANTRTVTDPVVTIGRRLVRLCSCVCRINIYLKICIFTIACNAGTISALTATNGLGWFSVPLIHLTGHLVPDSLLQDL